MRFYERWARIDFLGVDSVQITTSLWQKTFNLTKDKLKTISLISVSEILSNVEDLDFYCVLSKDRDGEVDVTVYARNSSKNMEKIGCVVIGDSPQIFRTKIPIK